MFWVEHAFHPILTAVSSLSFRHREEIALEEGLDLSNPASPTELGSAAMTSYAQGVRMSPDGNYAHAVLAEYPSALHVLDIRNPASPVSITNIPLDSAFGEGVEI